MCLAIPAKVVEIGDDNLAIVDILGATREVSLDLTPTATIGSYVLVHAGFAIEVVDEQFANETIELIKEFPELAEEEVNGAHYANAAGVGAKTSDGSAQGNLSMQQMLSQIASEI